MKKSLVSNIISEAISAGNCVVLHLTNCDSKRLVINASGCCDFVCHPSKFPELTIGNINGNRFNLEKEFLSYDNIVRIEVCEPVDL